MKSAMWQYAVGICLLISNASYERGWRRTALFWARMAGRTVRWSQDPEIVAVVRKEIYKRVNAFK